MLRFGAGAIMRDRRANQAQKLAYRLNGYSYHHACGCLRGRGYTVN